MTRGSWKIFVLFAVFLVAIPVLATFPNGRMTGGGSVFIGGIRVTHGFELHCDFEKKPQNLEINWQGHRFHLESVSTTGCVAPPPDPRPPVAPIFRLDGTGFGRYDGQSGCAITYSLTDEGEPGTKDQAFFVISCPGLGTVLSGGGLLTFGNQQAHRANP
jgi:hypothetical protein